MPAKGLQSAGESVLCNRHDEYSGGFQGSFLVKHPSSLLINPYT